MVTIKISDFSCIKEAEFRISRVNVLIGPQGSGKSITVKLLYFLLDTQKNFLRACVRLEAIEEYQSWLKEEFVKRFPVSTWGEGYFNISAAAGEFSVKIERNVRKKEQVFIKFSNTFIELYNKTLSAFKEYNYNTRDKNEIYTSGTNEYWRIKDSAESSLTKYYSENYISNQVFIPASRSYFTTMGRFIAVFEHTSMLDPIAIEFASLFGRIRESRAYVSLRDSSELNKYLGNSKNFAEEIFGGQIKFGRDLDYVDTVDRRRVPFSFLSSGQQELLPIWMVIDYLNRFDFVRGLTRRQKNKASELLYVEEPEAHLFPAAQARLLDFLIATIQSQRANRALILTTHSPYILARINIYLQAHHTGRTRSKKSLVQNLVPEGVWLAKDDLTAIAIVNNRVVSLIDEDVGLINAEYIDSVSATNADLFEKILDIQHSKQGKAT